MSSSDDENNHQEDDSLCKYGTQLPQYEADEIPSKKPIQVEDMVVKDENGRRRFHGAFTGGFSAGYWNTVGSKEGFTPTEFKSSRSEKTSVKTFKATDFMDEEDFSEFGIAPHKIQTKEDFGNSSGSTTKRKREKPSEGPIPGDPVLQNLLKPVHDKAAVRILKNMGWRDHQGIGSRMTYSEKKRVNERNKREMYIHQKYQQEQDEDDNDLSDDEEEITFAPDDFDPYLANIKTNTFGLGYSGLQPSSEKKHINLFQSFQVIGKNNKKFSITGQAFGVGALEEDDDDIYAGDDMSNYDKTLESEKRQNNRKITKPIDASMIEGFSRATINDSKHVSYSVDIPRNFTPRNWLQRKSRFEPIDRDRAKHIETQNKYKVLGLGRHDLKPEERGALLNDEKPKEIQKPPPPPKEEDKHLKSLESAKKIHELLNSKQFVSENSNKNETFKPFIGYPEKQERYEKFLALKTSDDKDIDKLLNDIQPLSMSAFDREREKKEFMQAKRMYQPLDSLIGNRFIKEVDIQKEQQVQLKKTENGKEVIAVECTRSMWKPHKTLCKLFNVPEPFGGMMFDEEEEKKKKKQSSSLFDYIGIPLNTKTNFITPQIIPRKLTEDNRKKTEEDEKRKSFLNAIEKEKSFMNKRAAAKDFFDNDVASTSKVESNDKETKEKDVKRKEPEVPKTELEIKVAESINKKPEEKKDLFKSIFCDSDEDEDDDVDGNNVEESKQSNAQTEVLSEKQKSTFIESFLNTKSASEINVLRNASPPRGIFKSIFEVATSSRKEKEIAKEDEVMAEDEEEAYGPKLPTNISIPPTSSSSKNGKSEEDSSSSDSSLDVKLLKKLKKAKTSRREEKWVEKDKVKKAKKHHKKKSQKKHKKHKSRK